MPKGTSDRLDFFLVPDQITTKIRVNHPAELPGHRLRLFDSATERQGTAHR